MTWQNRQALNWLLAEKGGAMKKLKELRQEVDENDGKNGSLRSMLANAAAKQMINVVVGPLGMDNGCYKSRVHSIGPGMDELDDFL
ncbi:hypothetical protein PO909_034113 [Leuciscus waleckii]